MSEKNEAIEFASYIHKYFPTKSGTENLRCYSPAVFGDIPFKEYSIDELYRIFKRKYHNPL